MDTAELAIGPSAMHAPKPNNEAERLAALHRYLILDTSPEREFDELATLAARICGTPAALVSLVDCDRLWFKAKVGFEATQTRDIAFCAHAICGAEPMVVPDATRDKRFARNPLVTSDPGIRFYAGAPLLTPDGYALGTLCVIDRVPRELSPSQADALRMLSRQVVSQMELRRARIGLEESLDQAKKREHELRTAEEFKTRMIECSRDCIKVLDLEGRLLSMNAGGMEILEICDFAPLCGTIWVDFWHGTERQAAQTAVEAARTGGVGRFTGYCPTMGGKPMWWDVVVSAIRSPDGAPERLLAVSRDATERVQAENSLRAALAEVEELTNRLEEENVYLRRELIANVSHDLRSPLASIRGYLEMLLLKGDTLPPDKRHAYLEIAARQSEHLGTLVSELFELAKLDYKGYQINPEAVQLAELAQDVLQKFQLIAEKRGISLQIEAHQDAGFVRADIALLERVLENLLENALKHTQTGGTVSLAVRRHDGGVAVEVSDTGSGIPQNALPHIFDRFYQVDRSKMLDATSAGLGLAIVKRILDLHHCQINVESALAQGTRFSFALSAASV